MFYSDRYDDAEIEEKVSLFRTMLLEKEQSSGAIPTLDETGRPVYVL